MKNHSYYLFLFLIFLCTHLSLGQGSQGPTLITTAVYMREVPSVNDRLRKGAFISPVPEAKEVNPRRGVPSRNYNFKAEPKGGDPLLSKAQKAVMFQGEPPLLTFDALEKGSATPTDPTGAVGPNHYVNAYNSGFRIYDRAGNPLTPHASLATIWPGESTGDPIVLYDRYVDRWVITQFSGSPNGILIAYSKGPDPVNDGWYTYRFNTNSFPDYPKYSIWSDGIYMTANKDASNPGSGEVVYVFERDDMISGAPQANVQAIAFPLPGIVNNGFYSPLPFHADGQNGLPPKGTPNFIAYMQDDVWSGVTSDHVKLWEVKVNWANPSSSTISNPTQIPVSSFDGLFDNGSFSNLPQPSGSDIDALQATMMYMMPYYRFGTHNSVLMNWVVDLNGKDEYSGIRWLELRQSSDGQPWTVYQEGTHTLNDGVSRFSGSMAMSASGDIGLAYTAVSKSVFPSLRYSGRRSSDPLGQMTLMEREHSKGTSSDPASRYGDYAQLVLDPTDNQTFWHIGEYFKGGGRYNGVAAFRVGSGTACPPDLTITKDVTGGVSDQKASKTITASNVIYANATANYAAGERIILVPGFHARSGSTFRAFIQDCTPTANAPLAESSSLTVRADAWPQEEMEVATLVLYPNPAKDRVAVSYPFEKNQVYKVSLHNYLGQLKLEQQLGVFKNNELMVDKLPEGAYIVKLLLPDGRQISQKLILSK